MQAEILDLNFRGASVEREVSLPEIMVTPPPPPSAPESLPSPRANILMVDDTPENLVALEAVLVGLGQNLIKARSGEEALRLLLKHDFAVILLDVNMPGISGFETAEMIRQRKSTEHIPIIFVSAISTSETHLFKGYSLGAVDYIFTPVIPEVLRSKVSVFVELLKKTDEVRHQAEQLRNIEQREHRQRLNEAAQRLQLQTKQNRFFTLSVDLLAMTDFQGFIKEANPAWQRVLGYEEQELKSCPFTSRMEQMEAWQALKAIEQAVRQQSPVHFEAQYPCKTDGMRCFAWTVAPYAAEQLLYLFARDVTDARRAEREIKQLNSDLALRASQLQATNAELQSEVATRKAAEQALQDSNSALEAFSFSVSHDLRAPLRAMQGFAKVLLEDYGAAFDEMGRECATRIVVSAEKMDSLVNDLLIFSRLGHTTLQLEPVSLQEIALDVLGQLDQEIKNKNAVVSIIEPLPFVQAHILTLTQAVLNLVINGLKFVTPGVPPLLKLYANTSDGFATFWVEDNGIGIPVEHQARIFRVFERLHGAEQYPGTGLGLAIVRKALERMGGEAGVESSPGTGSKFWLKLPLA